MRYAEGRLRHFWNRQVLGLMGACVIGFVFSPALGLAVAALILGGEGVDCLILSYVLGRSRKVGLLPVHRRLAAASGGFQISALVFALGLSHQASDLEEMHFFVLALLAGVTINAGLIRAYFPAGTDLKLLFAGAATFALLLEHMADPNTTTEGTYLFAASLVILALTAIMIIRQIERAILKRQELERSMAERNADLRRSRDELARGGAINRRLALAARHANDAIVFLGPDGRYQWVNEAFTRITGYSADQAIGHQPGDLLNAAETSRETLDRLDAARRGALPIRVEILNRNKMGHSYWVDTSIIPILDEQGRHVVSLAIERDVTEAKQREAELATARQAAEEAAQAKARFLANMSHEIRTPMNGVIGVSELLAETPLSQQQEEYVATILESGRALLTLINDILDLSKLQAGKIVTVAEPFDLKGTVHGVWRLLQPAAQAKKLDLSVTFADDPDAARHFVLGDQGKLRQILLNLIGNALKFTERGQIRICVTFDGDTMTLTVTDTGIGIGPDRITTIFDSFTQADDSISRRFGGTGLGLTISAMLAHQMGGKISVQSRVAEGSCFTLILPLPKAKRAALAPLARHDAAPNLGTLRLLVAEDNRTNMMIVRKVVAGHIAELIETSDGLSAVAAWHEAAPDMILMDVSMPIMDGLTAVRRIRAAEQVMNRPRCAILALTASDNQEDRDACMAAGFDGFLVKPLRREDLLAALGAHKRMSATSPVALRA